MALPTIYFDTGGATTNSGSTDTATATLTGTAATVAGSVVTLLTDNPDLSAIPTDGSATIALADASNSNQKIFKITAVDNTVGVKTVTVSVAPTGVVSSAWAIGGQMVYTPANWEGAAAAGWIFQFNNSPASRSGAAFLTCRASGNGTDGYITVRGKSGVRPVLTITDTNNVQNSNSQALWWFENLEYVQQGASGNVLTFMTGGVHYNVKVSDGGGVVGGLGNCERYIGCEFSGLANHCFDAGQVFYVHGCYIHDVGGVGIKNSNQGLSSFTFNVIDTCGGQGIQITAAPTDSNNNGYRILNNTVYGCGNSGLEITDKDQEVEMIGNIFQDNGNAAGEFNIEWLAGTAELVSIHLYNVFYHAGGGGGANLSGLTANATESTSDPLFVNAAGGDFSLKAGSPAKHAGFPGQLLGGSLGYLDMGAVQMRGFPAPIFGGMVVS